MRRWTALSLMQKRVCSMRWARLRSPPSVPISTAALLQRVMPAKGLEPMATDHANDTLLKPFRDPAFVARYVEGPPRFVPGFADLHRMTDLLLAERAPEDARLLVLGAGGGLELKALAQAHPLWRFAGVDPAPEMLKLAKDMLGPLASRVALVEGYIDDAPEGPF